MDNSKLIIGRDQSCDFIIFDPEKRVSRRHAELIITQSRMLIKDLGSKNGVYINNKRIEPNKDYVLTIKDKITLSKTYKLNLNEFLQENEEQTLILNKTNSHTGQNLNSFLHIENEKAVFKNENKTIVFDRDKTTIGDLSVVDNSSYKTIGRNAKTDFVIDDSNVSRDHCNIRLISNLIIELIDLNSTNGTYADGEKLIPNKKYQFSSSVILRIGKTYHLDLRSIFPSIQIIQRKRSVENNPPHKSNFDQAATEFELKQFYELEKIWDEYTKRQNEAHNASNKFGIGGMVVGAALGALTGGVAGVLLASGGGIFGRYLGQQESSKIRQDLSFETAFLEIYSCPRCKESFQKKPWITIRDCFKCKLKFRK
jgi:pSer/pThr/pTyr-binding forkhead associated (FHA) protein